MAYTSDSEFSLEKRIQITNEIPTTSLFHLLPQGLRGEFWRYLIGMQTVTEDVEYIDEDSRPMKIVNGTEAPIYGPEEESYHSLELEGVVLPELDLFLHEIYRYFDAVYPDHPDYEVLLTPLEINEAFYSAAAVIGYVPDYKFLEIWSKSLTGFEDTREALKWRIRDLRSIAYRRKFYGSYIGYKLIPSSIQRHGSVYLVEKYNHINYATGEVNSTNPQHNRPFRLMDFFGANDEGFRTQALLSFTGAVLPLARNQIFETTQFLFAEDVSELTRSVLGSFINDVGYNFVKEAFPGQSGTVVAEEGTTAIFELTDNGGDWEVSLSSASIVHVLNLSVPTQISSESTYYISDDPIVDVDVVGWPSVNITLDPRAQGLFQFGPAVQTKTGIKLYPDTIILDPSTVDWAASVSSQLSLDNTKYLGREVLENGLKVTEKLNVLDLESGYVTIHTTVSQDVLLSLLDTINRESIVLVVESAFEIDTAVVIQVETQNGSGVDFTVGAINATTNYITFNKILSFLDPETLEIPATNEEVYDSETNNALLDLTLPTQEDFLGLPFVSGQVKLYQPIEGGGGISTFYTIGEFNSKTTLQDLSLGAVVAGSDTASTPLEGVEYEQFLNRISAEFQTQPVTTQSLIFEGTTTTALTSSITLQKDSEQRKMDYISTGDFIRGPGIPFGAKVLSVSREIITIDKEFSRSGTYEFTVEIEKGRLPEDVRALDFKDNLKEIYGPNASTLTPNLFLWPSTIWPRVGEGYTEGLKDVGLFQYPATYPEYLTSLQQTLSGLLTKIFSRWSFEDSIVSPDIRDTLNLSYVGVLTAPAIKDIRLISREYKKYLRARTGGLITLNFPSTVSTEFSMHWKMSFDNPEDVEGLAADDPFQIFSWDGGQKILSVKSELDGSDNFINTHFYISFDGGTTTEEFQLLDDEFNPVIISSGWSAFTLQVSIDGGNATVAVLRSFGSLNSIATTTFATVETNAVNTDSAVFGEALTNGLAIDEVTLYSELLEQQEIQWLVDNFSGVETSKHLSLPNTEYKGQVFLELSLDRILKHTNFLGGSRSLIDIPWLDYLKAQAEQVRRASEDVRVGVQLNMTTDLSGLFSVTSETSASDASTGVKFITFPFNYNNNDRVSYVRFGSGIPDNGERLFLSVSDLKKPPLYGPAVYDKDVYTFEPLSYSEEDLKISIPEDVVTPLFEVPIGVYEDYKDILFPLREDYHGILFTLIEESFRDVSLPIEAGLQIYSPKLTEGSRAPASYTFKGQWLPKIADPLLQNLDYPDDSPSEADYYDVIKEGYYLDGGSVIQIPKDSALVYEGAAWKIKPWKSLGLYDISGTVGSPVYPDKELIKTQLALLNIVLDGNGIPKVAPGEGGYNAEDDYTYVEIDDTDLTNVLPDYFFYFMLTGEGPEIDGNLRGSWLVLADYADLNALTWEIKPIETLSILKADVDLSVFANDPSGRESVIAFKETVVGDYSTIAPFPRRFLTEGSVEMVLKIDTAFEAIPAGEVDPVSITSSPFYWDEDEFKYFVLEADGETKHFIDFKDPKYFKNLSEFVGLVDGTTEESRNQIVFYEDFPFPSNLAGQTSGLVRQKEIFIRNAYNSALEMSLYNQNIAFIAEPVESDDIGNPGVFDRLVTPSNSLIDTQRFADFQEILNTIDNGGGDILTSFRPMVKRTYSVDQENKYFRDLLLIAGTVYSTEPSRIYPLYGSAESQAAILDAIDLLTAGDIVRSVYSFSNGSDYNSTPINWTSNSSAEGRVLLAPDNDYGLWLAAGRSGELFTAAIDPTTTWTDKDPLNTFSGIDFLCGAAAPNGQAIGFFVAGTSGTLIQVAGTNVFDFTTSLGISDTISSLAWLPTLGTEGGLVVTTNAGDIYYGLWEDATSGFSSWTASNLPTDTIDGSDTFIEWQPSGSSTEIIDSAISSLDTMAVLGYRQDNIDAVPINRPVIALATDIEDPDDGGGGFHTDGRQWITAPLPAGWPANTQANSISFGDGVWIAGGEGGNLIVSSDDFANTTHTTLPVEWAGVEITKVEHYNGLWTILGAGGYLAVSPDGENWDVSIVADGTDFRDIAVDEFGQYVIIKDSDEIIYSSAVTAAGTTLAIDEFETIGAPTIKLNADPPNIDFTNLDAQTILIAVDCQKSVPNNTIGIPTESIQRFTNNDGRALVTDYISEADPTRATRAYFPRLEDAFPSEAYKGYPTPAENAAIWTDEIFTNSSGLPIYRSNINGGLVTVDGVELTVTDFVGTDSENTDPREVLQTPDYGRYEDWLEAGNDLASIDSVEDINVTITGVTNSSPDHWIDLDTTIDLSAYASYGDVVAQFSLVPTAALTPSDFELVRKGALVFQETGGARILENIAGDDSHLLSSEFGPVTGLYIPTGGYGDFDGGDSAELPWIKDPDLFNTGVYVVNAYRDFVYLIDENGDFILDGGSQKIKVVSPKYVSYRDALNNVDRIFDNGNTFSTLGTSVEDFPKVTGVTGNSLMTFSEPLVALGERKTVRLLLVNTGTTSFATQGDNKNDSDYFLKLRAKDISSYPPDRVSFENSTKEYQQATNASQQTTIWRNLNGTPIILSVDDTGLVPLDANNLVDNNAKLVPQTYYSNQEQYTAEFHLEGQESNPYWHYISVKDEYDLTTSTWSQRVRVLQPKKLRKTIGFEDVTGRTFFTAQTGIRLQETVNTLEVLDDSYVDYTEGRGIFFLVMDPTWTEEKGERFGIEFDVPYDADYQSVSNLILTNLTADMEASYVVNSKRNFANPQDQISPVVGLTEMGIFNTDNEMIAYATFPPIIYNTVRHHCSFNVFIKDGLFGSASAT
mgnify:CR=1 FL=1